MVYKPLLSEKQQIYLDAFLEEDNSFVEIAEAMEVSRQAVFDNIKKACRKLEYYESMLNILKMQDSYLQNLIELREDFSKDKLEKLITEMEGSDV